MATIDDDNGLGAGKALRRGPAGLAVAGLRRLADIVVPPVCLACQRPLGSHDCLCPLCWRQIRFIRPPLCDRLGIPMPFDTGGTIVSGAALRNPPDWDRARAVAKFGPVLRDLIHKFKYSDRLDARRLFGKWLAEAGSELIADADVLVPVPLHRWRLLWRKFNQAAMLANEVGRLTGTPVDPFAVRRSKSTRPQVGLSEAARRRNLAGAFEVPKRARAGIEGRKVLLIDDVFTTGSTVAACARVLKRSGAARVDVLVLAMVIDGESDLAGGTL
jgi:ComF family protein